MNFHESIRRDYWHVSYQSTDGTLGNEGFELRDQADTFIAGLIADASVTTWTLWYYIRSARQGSDQTDDLQSKDCTPRQP